MNGLAFGLVEAAPGMSGGTIAIMLGFYNELIETVNHFTKDFKKHTKFGLPIVAGIATGMLISFTIIKYLLDAFRFPTMAFFIGLIVGIIPLIFRKVKRANHWFTLKEMTLILLPFLVLVILSFLKPITIANSADNISIPFMLYIAITGIIAASALVIPGTSGMFMLLLLGVYELVVDSFNSLIHLLTNTSLILPIAKVLVPLAVGIIIGVLTMARLIEKLLKNHYKTTYCIILGLLAGSVFAIFKEQLFAQSDLSAWSVIIGIFTLCAGSMLSFRLGKSRL